jgi:pyruvate kinase
MEVGKPVITATQMLESMTSCPVPTRAEVSDVANAVYDGTDATMLSGESAYGDYPKEAVAVMAKVQAEARKHYGEFTSFENVDYHEFPSHTAPEVVARAAVDATWNGSVDTIVVMSYSGAMAQRIAKYRPEVPIIALTPNESVYYQMCLLYAVLPAMFNVSDTTEATLTSIQEWLLNEGLVVKGSRILICAGTTELAGLSNSFLLTTV